MQADNDPRLAPAPFDDTDADLVLCTSDDVAFRVSSFYLRKASRIFEDMLAVPQPAAVPANELIDGKAVVRLTETSAVIDAFLRCICPIPKKALDVSQIAAVYAAGNKYMADAVKSYAVAEVSRYVFHREHCFRAYVLACQFGLRKEAGQAAKKTIEISQEEILDANFPELDDIPASSLTQLTRYRRACLASAQRVCGPTYWINKIYASEHDDSEFESLWLPRMAGPPKCKCPKSNDARYDIIAEWSLDFDEAHQCVGYSRDIPYQVNYWCTEYLGKIADDLGTDTLPIREALRNTDGFAKAVEAAANCPFCRPRAVKDLISITHLIEAEVDKAIAEVPFPFVEEPAKAKP